MFPFPALPEVPAAQRAAGTGHLRYEDICQDGRVLVAALPHAIGLTLWQGLLDRHPLARAAATTGVVPVLTRLVIEGTDASVSVRRPFSAEGGYRLAHTADAAGAVDRLLLETWVALAAPLGRTHGPPPPGAGTVVPL